MTASGNRARLLLLLLVGGATLLSLTGISVTTAQGTTLFAVRNAGPLPVDAPFDPAWDAVRPLPVVLGGQAVVPPMRIQPSVAAVRVRAMVNDTDLALEIEWDDATLDESVLAVDRFADAAAIQLALGNSSSICMGQQAGGLNIWHWKADWAADLARRRDIEDVNPNMPMDVHLPPTDWLPEDGFLAGRAAGNLRSAASRASSVEDLNAVGFGSLTAQPAEGQNVHGASDYRDGIWRVVMSRQLATPDGNDARPIVGGDATSVAFAVWNGSSGDRDGQKSVSTWIVLALPAQPPSLLDPTWPFLAMIVLVMGLSAVLMYIGARQPAIGLGGPMGPADDSGDG